MPWDSLLSMRSLYADCTKKQLVIHRITVVVNTFLMKYIQLSCLPQIKFIGLPISLIWPVHQGCRSSVIFRYFWPDLFSYFIFLFLNFLSLFVFIFYEAARTRRFSVIFAKVQWHPWLIETSTTKSLPLDSVSKGITSHL